MTEKRVSLTISSFQDGLSSHGSQWKIEKRLFDGEQLQILHSAALAGEPIQFTVEGPVRSGWSFVAKVAEAPTQFVLEAQGEQKPFNRAQSERLAQEATELKPYSFINIGTMSAVVSHMHGDGTFQVVYEQSPGRHIAEDAKFDGEKYAFCIDGPNGSYADRHSHYAPFISALKRRYR